MARVIFDKTYGIASLSGRIGPLIFYTRKGKTYVRTDTKNVDSKAIMQALCCHCAAIMLSDDAFKPN